MSRMLFVSLPVRSISESRQFFGRLGFRFDPEFSDDKALCVVVADNIFVMLLQEEFFRTFINGDLSPSDSTEVLNCLTANSRAEIDELVGRAIEAGGKPWKDPVDEGPMYGWSFQDIDGHVWELMYMDPAAQS